MITNTEVKIFETPKKVYKAISKEIIKHDQKTNQAKYNIALSGGNSPKGLFKKMSKKYADSIPWSKIHFWWGDERCVSPHDNESNYKLAVDYMLSKVNIPKENIHRIRGEKKPVEESERYSEEIASNLNFRNGIPVFDLIILGLGNDGHTASIFPNQMKLLTDERICAVARHPVSGQKRITLTGQVINNANRVFFLVTGESKANRISEIMNDNEAAKLLPAYHISPKNGRLIWFLDEAAASKI